MNLPCGCKLKISGLDMRGSTQPEIDFCPTHKHAEEMVKSLEECLDYLHNHRKLRSKIVEILEEISIEKLTEKSEGK